MLKITADHLPEVDPSTVEKDTITSVDNVVPPITPTVNKISPMFSIAW